jgi:hypothetical protein
MSSSQLVSATSATICEDLREKFQKDFSGEDNKK